MMGLWKYIKHLKSIPFNISTSGLEAKHTINSIPSEAVHPFHPLAARLNNQHAIFHLSHAPASPLGSSWSNPSQGKCNRLEYSSRHCCCCRDNW
jgi:hypothetical protein